MAAYILSILTSQLMVVFSWGLHNPTALPNDGGLAFKVNGYKHRGWVIIRYNEGADLFDIELRTPAMKLVDQIEGVYFDQLVEVIDNAVEKTSDYENRIKEQYSLQ